MQIFNILFSHIAILDTEWKCGNTLLTVIKKILLSKSDQNETSNLDQFVKTDTAKMKQGYTPDIHFVLNGNQVKFEWNSDRKSYDFVYDPLNWKNNQSTSSHIEFLNNLHLEYASRLVLGQIYSLGFKPNKIHSQKLSEFANVRQNKYIQIESTMFNLI